MFSTRRSNGSSLLCAMGLVLALPCLLCACGGGGGGDGGGTTADPEFVPDPSFGVGGLITGQGSGSMTRYERADVSDAGVMAVLGMTRNSSFTFGTLLVEKRHPDGSLIGAFGTGGQVEVTASPGYTPKGIALNDQDGSVLAVADWGLDGYSLHKFANDGSPVLSFGASGVQHVSTPAPLKVGGMVVDADGKIVVAGTTNGEGFVMRHLASGAPDPAWNGGAPYVFQILTSTTRILGLVHRVGGGYFVPGTRDSSPGPDEIFVSRFNTSGGPIPGYGTGGFCRYEPAVSSDVVGVVPRPDGACATYGETSADHGFALGVNPDGDVVRVFSYRELSAPLVREGLRGAHPRSSGDLLFGFLAQGSRDVVLWQVHESGGTDTDFGEGGATTIPMDADTHTRQLVPYPGNGLLLLGNRETGGGMDGVLMRFVPATP